jgi:hypothetical protein
MCCETSASRSRRPPTACGRDVSTIVELFPRWAVRRRRGEQTDPRVSDRPRHSFWRTILNIQPREFVVDSCHHRLTIGTGTVTESVVLPPLIGGAYNASIKAVCPGYPVPISGIVDWDRDLSPALVIADLVHLAGLQWPILIPDAKRVKQAAAGLMPRNVIVSCSWRRAGRKRRF